MMLLPALSFCTALVLFVIFRHDGGIIKSICGRLKKNKEGIQPVEDIIPVLDFDIHTTEPRPYRPWSSGKFAMTMGIRKLPDEDSFLLDNQYIKQQEFRRHLLAKERNGVMQYLPGSELACAETLDFIVKILTKRYPQLFVQPADKPGYLHNRITDLTFKVEEPYEKHPLEVAAQLVMEDINLLIQGAGDDPEQFYLRASFSMAPAGWYIQERIGYPLWRIHAPVPLWDQKLRKSIERFFINMKADAPVQRNNFFLQVNDNIFQQDPFPSTVDHPIDIKDVIIRHERQTLRRLPKSSAILFMVRTFFTPVTDLEREPESLRELLDSCLAMPEDVAKYKARQVWLEPLQTWAEEILGKKAMSNRSAENGPAPHSS